MTKLYNILKTAIWCFIGVFAGDAIYQYQDYHRHPGLYTLSSQPWYTGILHHAIFTIIVVLILSIILLILKKQKDE